MAAASPAAALNVFTVSGFGTDFTPFLTDNGFVATQTTSGRSEASDAAFLATQDVVILKRTDGTPEIADWVQSGGFLLTEWLGSAWALDTVSLLDADDDGGNNIGEGTPISLTAAGLAAGLGAGQPGGQWSTEPAATQFFRLFSSIGPGVDVLATRPGGIEVILGGASGDGYVLIGGWDWQDQEYDVGDGLDGNERFLLNALGYAERLSTPQDPSAEIPLPAAAPLAALGFGALAWMGRRRRG